MDMNQLFESVDNKPLTDDLKQEIKNFINTFNKTPTKYSNRDLAEAVWNYLLWTITSRNIFSNFILTVFIILSIDNQYILWR